MLRSSKLVAVAICGTFALTACTSVPQEAVDAERFSQATLDDPKVPIGPGSTIQVEAFEWGFRVEGVAVDGSVLVDFANVGGATHNFRIDNAAGTNKKVEADGGETAEGELALFGGATYTYYCDIPGHRAEGMEGELKVYLEGEAPDEAPADEPATDEPASDEPATDEPATDEPASQEAPADAEASPSEAASEGA